jgi:hypothetical protein
VNPSINNIDEYLVLKFLQNNAETDEDVLSHILKWKSAIEYSKDDESRTHAINFLVCLGNLSLDSIGYPRPQRDNLISIFNPLETILKTAISLNEKGKVRDHLNHTVRVVLFANYIYGKLKKRTTPTTLNKLHIAAVFHDIAYPIEKMKQVAHNITNATFSQYLNSKAKLEIEISDPSNLLNLLNFIGNLNHSDLKTTQRVNKLYKKIIVPAIASQGLFEAPHCLSSVVLFLRPLIDNYGDIIDQYWKDRINDICDISFAIANHDRKDLLNSGELIDCIISKSLRIADELQEWERDRIELSFINSIELIDGDVGNLVHLKFVLRDRNIGSYEENKFSPDRYIADKINGLYPVGSDSSIIIDFHMPRNLSVSRLLKLIEKGNVIISEHFGDRGLYIDPTFKRSKNVRMTVNTGSIIIRNILNDQTGKN